MKESAILIAKLLPLSRDGRIKWEDDSSDLTGSWMSRFQTTIDNDLLVSVWSTNEEAGFRVSEKGRPRWKGGDPLGNPPLNVGADSRTPLFNSGRDLVAISLSHELGSAQGDIYPSLMSLLELARIACDKVEPKIDRVKQYLDKLAV
jgi:hypothetical protein